MALDTLVDSKKLEQALKESPRVMRSYIKGGFLRVLRGFFKEFVAQSGVKLTKKSSNANRHAGLGRADQWRVKATGNTLDTIEGRIGTRSGIAKVLEKGGVIAARRGNLAIPLQRQYRTPAEARAQGVKLFARQAGRRTIVYEKKGERVTPLFLLVPSVRIPARLYFFRTWESASAQASRVSRLSEELNRGLKKVFGDEAIKEGAAG